MSGYKKWLPQATSYCVKYYTFIFADFFTIKIVHLISSHN